jgi:hypothetical protein
MGEVPAVLEGDARRSPDDRHVDRGEFVVVVGAAVALTALAVMVPIFAIVTGPAMLLTGLLGLRRAGAGPRLHLVLLAVLGAVLTLSVLAVALFLGRTG